MPDWQTRWQQTDDDELLYTPEEGLAERPASPWPPAPQAWVRSSLRQMAMERWLDDLEDES